MSVGIEGTWLEHPRHCVWVLVGALLSVNAQAQSRHCASLETREHSFGSASTQPTEPSFRQGPNFVVLGNAGALAESACMSSRWASVSLQDAAERLRVELNIDPQILVVLTTAPLSCADIYYLPYANDVLGIGYQHYDPREVFDDTPNSQLEGIAFLNDFPYWQAHPDEFSKDFKHELAHRWAARVFAVDSGVASPALLGRQLQHWSYFLDTGGSPLEGNSWGAGSASNTFTADTPLSRAEFSDFDLYLMGVLPETEVRPEALHITTDAPVDCLNRSLEASSPPQTCGQLSIAATTKDYTIRAVVDAEGARIPASDASTHTLDVAILVLEKETAPLDTDTCLQMTRMLDDNITAFERSTRQRMILQTVSTSAATCELLAAASTRPGSESPPGCAIGRPTSKRVTYIPLLFLVALGLCKCGRLFTDRHRHKD